MGKIMEWTFTEIEEMKKAFLQGEQIKIIAKKLGRTPTALNKALSRFGIRPPRKKNLPSSIPLVDWKRYLLPKGIKEDALIALSSRKKQDNKFLKNRRYLQDTSSTWVSFSQILHYLERQGYHPVCINAKKGQYELNKKPVEKGHLLLFANRLRIEEAKSIFLVDEITW